MFDVWPDFRFEMFRLQFHMYFLFCYFKSFLESLNIALSYKIAYKCFFNVLSGNSEGEEEEPKSNNGLC